MPAQDEGYEIVSSQVFDGVKLAYCPYFEDQRGYFTELLKGSVLRRLGVTGGFLQANASRSKAGTLRGLHFQYSPSGQGKLIRCLQGKIFDVGVDINPDSSTFGQWEGWTLTPDGPAVYLPATFAHGFLALEDSVITYACTDFYDPNAEGGVRWDSVGIQWPEEPQYLSERDQEWGDLKPVEAKFKKLDAALAARILAQKELEKK